MIYFPITLSVLFGSSLLVAIFFNSVLVAQFMTVEDKDMPLKRIIYMSSIIAFIGIIIFIVGGEYRALGSVMVFTAIMLWMYRLFIRKMANRFQEVTLVKLETWYEKRLAKALKGRMPYSLCIGTLVLLIVAFMAFGASLATQRTKVEFFPDNKPNQIIVYIEYPQGTDIEKTNAITKEIEQKVATVLNDKAYTDDGYNFMVESTVSQVG